MSVKTESTVKSTWIVHWVKVRGWPASETSAVYTATEPVYAVDAEPQDADRALAVGQGKIVQSNVVARSNVSTNHHETVTAPNKPKSKPKSEKVWHFNLMKKKKKKLAKLA